MPNSSLLSQIRTLREKAQRARRLSEEIPSDRPARLSLAAYADDLDRRADELVRSLKDGSAAARRSPPDAKSSGD
jgi:hypothetical protein